MNQNQLTVQEMQLWTSELKKAGLSDYRIKEIIDVLGHRLTKPQLDRITQSFQSRLLSSNQNAVNREP